ncbi:unnamed protein product [Rotaria sp. Silwood2]|nr:unnamed protein product [Rotaria sp. Silwood2]CAF2770618.1 unnamed protein product [Rotaria sp. Silwood2]CAF3339342.1 unnamed protein product [Rotaria sp. Silwood2]CAF3436425.1 unnamed protein product [Rotaria sp. Silwood2]CAF3996706.1 unnamed protein product [Rotaria sp. Silwood2]
MYSTEPMNFDFTHDNICRMNVLEYLAINNCHMMDFLELLKHVGPNVKRMKIGISYERDQYPDSIDPNIIDDLLSGDDEHPKIPGS